MPRQHYVSVHNNKRGGILLYRKYAVVDGVPLLSVVHRSRLYHAVRSFGYTVCGATEHYSTVMASSSLAYKSVTHIHPLT